MAPTQQLPSHVVSQKHWPRVGPEYARPSVRGGQVQEAHTAAAAARQRGLCKFAVVINLGTVIANDVISLGGAPDVADVVNYRRLAGCPLQRHVLKQLLMLTL